MLLILKLVQWYSIYTFNTWNSSKNTENTQKGLIYHNINNIMQLWNAMHLNAHKTQPKCTYKLYKKCDISIFMNDCLWLKYITIIDKIWYQFSNFNYLLKLLFELILWYSMRAWQEGYEFELHPLHLSKVEYVALDIKYWLFNYISLVPFCSYMLMDWRRKTSKFKKSVLYFDVQCVFV